MLFNNFERTCIIKYNGMWGYKMPYYAPNIIIKYNCLKIKKEIVRKIEKLLLKIK